MGFQGVFKEDFEGDLERDLEGDLEGNLEEDLEGDLEGDLFTLQFRWKKKLYIVHNQNCFEEFIYYLKLHRNLLFFYLQKLTWLGICFLKTILSWDKVHQ